MDEVSLEGRKYKGIFNADKQTRITPFSVEWYEGAGIVEFKRKRKEYFFRFILRGRDYIKPELKETINDLAARFGFDTFLESIIFSIEKSETGKVIPKINLSDFKSLPD